MHLADEAWNEADTTIRNCYRKASILPPDTDSVPIQPTPTISSLVHATHSELETLDDPVRRAEDAVESALNDLEKFGILQRTNRMNIDEFLSPAIEAHQVFEATDEDIYQAVMDAKREQEESAKSGDVDSESDAPVEPVPTRKEALQASLLLQKYLNHLNDPFARKLEAMLGSFGQKTRTAGMQNMHDTKLTSYFPSKE